MAIRRILDLQLIPPPIKRHIELAFAGVDAGAEFFTARFVFPLCVHAAIRAAASAVGIKNFFFII